MSEYARRIAQQRSLPPIQWIAVAGGAIASVGIALLIQKVVWSAEPIFGIAAPLCGIAAGAFLAGKLAKYAGLYHGALVGVAYVAVEAIGLAPAPFDPARGDITESLWIIAGDASVLAVGALSGWIAARRAAPSSSWDRGRGQ